MTALTRWILAHKQPVTVFWLIVTVVGLATASSATNALSQQFSVPGRGGYETNLQIVTTVAAGLLALVALPVPFLRSVGYGGMLIPLVMVIVAIALLPVVLDTIGPRIDWPRRQHAGRASRFWTNWAGMICGGAGMRLPWRS